jgi:hypothetical protein
VAKLLDFEPQLSEPPHHANPFALVKAAHLLALRTRADVDCRLAAKRQLVRLLYRQGWGKQRVLDLFAVLDWMLRLPPPQEHQVWQDIEAIERSAGVKYVTSVERMFIEQGLSQGLSQGRQEGRREGRQEGQLELVTRQLTRRFGPLPDWATARLQAADASQLEQWADRVLDAPSLEAVFIGH